MAPELIEKGLRDIPAGQKVHFAATGDFFQDPHALDHVHKAVDLGHPVNVLSHGQSMPPERLEEMWRSAFASSVSASTISSRVPTPKIRRGGDLDRVLTPSPICAAAKNRSQRSTSR